MNRNEQILTKQLQIAFDDLQKFCVENQLQEKFDNAEIAKLKVF